MFDVTLEDVLERFKNSKSITLEPASNEHLREHFYPNEGLAPDDTLSLFVEGVKWAFEPLSEHFPRTYSALKSGTRFFLVHRPWISRDYLLFLKVKDRLLGITRQPIGRNRGDRGYSPKIDFAINSLPSEISNAFYTKFDGLCVLRDVDRVPFQNFLLPKRRNSWVGLNELAERHGHDKNTLFKDFKNRFPVLKHSNGGSDFFNMFAFLDTYIDNPEDKRTRYVGDYFFVKLHNFDQIIYHIRDGDYKNMRILSQYTQALDEYCSHTILRKKGRVNFEPYTKAFQW